MTHPAPPYSYDGAKAPEYALVGKPITAENGSIETFQLVLENTKTGKPATADQMKSFMQYVLDHIPKG